MRDRASKRSDTVSAKERKARALEAEIARAKRALASLSSRDPAGGEAKAAEKRLDDLEKRRLAAVRDARRERELAEKEEGDPSVFPVAQVGDLDRDLPLLLLPVRLETRFFQQPDETWELWIRIYPDEIHVDGHEPELTASEIEWGQHFWEQVWKWGNDEARTNAAWQQLVQRFGGARASWIASSLTPKGFEPGYLTRPFKSSSAGPPPLEFPKVDERGSTWSRPARAGLLPDSWTVWGWAEGFPSFAASTGPIRRRLPVGPDPASLGEPGRDPEPVDEGMRWMVDFEKALTAGMALRVNLDQQDRVDTLIAFGIRSGDPPDLSKNLMRHVQALRYGRGIDFLRQGTPTNNTDAVRAEYDAGIDDDASVEGMLRELGPMPEGQDYDNSEIMADTLWLHPAAFARLPRGRETEQLDARKMNDLLWATTWGYYLSAMIGPTVIPNPVGIDWVREHWVDYVRSRGPLPALRVGDQPYGILPVLVGVALDPQQPEEYLEVVLRTARSIWDESAPLVTQLRLNSPDSDRDLVQALATLPHPERFGVRGVVGRSTLRAVAQNMTDPWDGWQFDLTGVRSFLVEVFNELGITGRPQILNVVYTDGSREWVNELVTAKGVSDTAPLGGNYLEWMAKAQPGKLIDENHPYEKDTLLYVLARRSGHLEDTGGTGTPAPRRFREAARHLSTLPTALLEQLLRETLGACAYRLDAWETSLATRQLETMRNRVEADPLLKGGIQIGGYGWVENLVARPPLVEPETDPDKLDETDPDKPAPDEAAPTDGALIDPTNKGFVLAPTVQHATTASVLRSGWLSHGAGPQTPMAVDLSSARARDASELLDGVRNGLGLGELLGYRFERALHEGHPGIELDRFVRDFRELAPLVAGKQMGTEDPNAGATAQAAPSVVDGLRLLELYRAADTALASLLDDIEAESLEARTALEDEMRALAGAVDTVADAAMAEGVHQVLLGNQVRAGAVTDAVTTGELPPPELEINSPIRTGRGITHRLVLSLGPTSPSQSNWPGAGVSPRARTEPRLENWLASLFGEPDNIVAQVGYILQDQEEPSYVRAFHLSELGLGAIDALMLTPGQKADSGELGARMCWELLRGRPADVPEDSRLHVDGDWNQSLQPGQVPLADFLMMTRTLRQAVAEARPLRASDLAVPADGIERNVNLDELFQRGSVIVTELGAAVAALDAIDDTAPPDQLVEPLREALKTVSNLGIPGAFPRSVVGDGDAAAQALLAQRAAVLARARTRLAEAGDDASVSTALASASDREAETLLTERLRRVCGKGFPVLPVFTAPNAPALAATFGASEALQEGDAFASAGWLERAAKVQPRAGTFLRAIQFAEALSDQTHLALEVGQLPYRVGEVWVGLPQGGRQAPRGGRVSLVAQTFGALELDAPLQGLVLDEWTEVIPKVKQTAGLAFHFDAPGSRAPQSLLVLALIDAEPAWTVPLIQTALRNTLDASRRRLADSNALVDGGHFVPAVFLETDSGSGELAGDLARGLIKDEDAILVEHERPEIDIEIGPIVPPP